MKCCEDTVISFIVCLYCEYLLRGEVSVQLTSSDQLLFTLKLYFFYKTTYLNEEVNVGGPFSKYSLVCV